MTLPLAPKPATVRLARLLLALLAAMQLLSGLLAVLFLDDIRAGYVDAFGDPDSASKGTVSAVTGLVLCAVYALIIIVPALLLGRPRQWVRVTTIVLAGLSYCCVSPQMFGGVSMASPRISSGSGGPSRTQVDQSLADHLPGWYGLANVAFAVIGLLAVTGIIVLLLLPPSAAWFRRPVVAGPPAYGPPPFGPPAYGPPPSGPPAYGPPPSGPPAYGPPPQGQQWRPPNG
ncbi:hypothetical protein ACFO1B_18790 [Dactylosporangium siamense]|uniref:Uncharacterized protein n=1 Tax=Dactylosporangium siamense TaxID=685454 RepID=A0A919PIM8_9ACTN|nr:hypothetical protein [Dactylosporangium siamense]GIG43926.1 hypothetical protein Dsi01nite_019670 [Dactylosporangium siamense]